MSRYLAFLTLLFSNSINKGFPWNLVAFAWTDYIYFLQTLSFIGTYSFNLLSVTFFLIPTIILFKYSKFTKLSFLAFLLMILTINFFYGSLIIKNNEKISDLEQLYRKA